MKVMKRFDRAMYAIFLLVLLADVVRAHASVAAGADAGLILNAARQLQAGSSDDALLVLRHSDRSSVQRATLDRFARRFSAWSRGLSDFSNPVLQSQAALPQDAASCLGPCAAIESASPAPSIFEHTGSPAP
jgi:hypothetical protein